MTSNIGVLGSSHIWIWLSLRKFLPKKETKTAGLVLLRLLPSLLMSIIDVSGIRMKPLIVLQLRFNNLASY